MAHYHNVSTHDDDLDSPFATPTTRSTPIAGTSGSNSEDELIDMYGTKEAPVASAMSATQRRQLLTERRNLKNAKHRKSVVSAHITHVNPLATSRRKKILIISLCVLAVVVIAVAVPVATVLIKKKGHGSSSSSNGSSGGGPGSGNTATSGTTGSLITMSDGTTFTYTNTFGGDWAEDPTSPFTSGGKAQNWSKRIGSEDWVWGEDVARGVNLGLYEKYVNKTDIFVVDEWTLALAMDKNLASEMEDHYKTFITEQDFADIAGAGLNWVRIPIGFWAIETIGDEPFLVGTSWSYFLKAIEWGRKYGIRIFLDLHALPGSQNGWNHSGKSGSNGVMGIANAERTLTYLRILTEFVSQDQYRDVVGIVGIVNEILWATIGQTSVQSFYYAAYEAIRTSTGIGSGAGPYIAIHEGFQGVAIWEGFLSGADRIALDQHPYLAFTGDHTSSVDQLALKPCAWAIATNQSSKAFGVTLGGEWSTAVNDCGLWLNGIGSTPGYPDCTIWDDWASYNASTIAGIKNVALASMDALQNFFFWTWKIGNSTQLGTSSSPLWHYQLGLQQGWVPKDPREAIGHCASVLSSSQIFDGSYPATATGGSGAGTVEAAQTSSHVFPPPSLAPSFSPSQMSLLPTYTPTGSIKTLFAPTFTAAPKATVGTGWNNSADTQLAYV
ncbi:glycoside hydrolase [Guyanagaster necrorhizus]|uniref:glucan 1,3-beta-glucosidase n=1 Tax=Guyanagaster necrorhizus TaxID=856835 RepID=A0A9P7VTF1_9AGAR|nr:glycoside hydrolase [Guyanagaster necrorhizus MCA 3950]KAG7445616.1 glycoside hydrolase [Guyanagaster necrorhizus MCA 3950]